MLASPSKSSDISHIITPPADLSDKDIIKRIKAGDANAYGSIMRRYNQRIFRIARSIVTDDAAALDIVQEAHIKAYTRIDKFRGDSLFITWLASITRNEALMYIRKHKKEVSLSNDQILEFPDMTQTVENQGKLPDAILDNSYLKKLLNKNIDKIPEDFRSVFVLRAIEEFSVKETAEILDLKEETVKTRFFRAKRLLRGQIQTYLDSVGLKIYEVGGCHCDTIVRNVMRSILKNTE